MFNDDPDQMTADNRLDELAALFADGFLRWKRRTGCLPSADMPVPGKPAAEHAAEKLSEKPPTGLEVSGD